MKTIGPTVLALALAAAFPAAAQSNAELLQELKALKERVNELEKKLQAAQPAQPGQWGMTPEQQREFNRIAVKAEGLQDNFADQGFKGLKITGQIDPSFIYSRAQDNAGFVFLNREDGRYTFDNSYFGMAVLDFEKETDYGVKWKLTLAPERGTGSLFNGGSIVHEATVSLPLGDLQTRLWLGQIPDWTGYEYTLPALNKFITHNLLFDTTAPTAYTGAALDIKRGKWWTRVGLANMNSARIGAGNKQPVFTYRVDYSKGEFEGFGFTGVHGKAANLAADGTYQVTDPDTGEVTEKTFDSAGKHSRIDLLEFDAYFVRGDVSMFGQVSWGKQKGAAIFNSDGVLRDAEWWGVSTSFGYKLTPRLEALLRADYIRNNKNGGGLLGYVTDDPVNGIGRGIVGEGFAKGESVGANRYAISAGLNWVFDENTNFKFELRRDGSNQPVFLYVKDGSFRKSNTLLGASVVVRF